MEWVHAGLMAMATIWSMLSVWAVRRVLRRGQSTVPRQSPPLEPVSVLKPLRGADDDLESNLRSYFVQRHPAFQLVFGVQGPDDPAVGVVRKLERAFPHVPCKLVIHDGRQGLNPKVANLRAMWRAADHDVLLISDSNVTAAPDALARMQCELQVPGVGLVCSPIAGVGERSLGATLENLYLNGWVSAGMVVPTELFGHPAVVGKSLMFRRSVLDTLGGLESLAHVLAEDYVMGRMFAAAGYRVRIGSQPVFNTCRHTTLPAFFQRQMRWAMMRVRLAPVPYVLELLSMPWLVALLAPAFGASLGPALAWGLGVQLVRDGLSWQALRGCSGLARALPWFWLRDLGALLTWLAAPLVRHVAWRGHRLRLSAGTRLYSMASEAVGRSLP